jgi:hypothetical protein
MGRTLNATMATIVTISMVDASSTSSATTAVVVTTSTTTRRVSPSARARASSPDAYMASTSITCLTSIALIRAIKSVNYNNKHKQQQYKHSRNDMCTTCHECNNHWTSSEASHLAEPVTLSLSSDKRTSASADNKKYHFGSTPKNKEDASCLILWPSHSNFKSSSKRKNNFGWLFMTRMPRLVHS